MKDPVTLDDKRFMRNRLVRDVPVLERSTKWDTGDVKLLNTLSRMALEYHLIEASERFAQKAVGLNRRDPDALINSIQLCAAKGEFEQANTLAGYLLDVDENARPSLEGMMGQHLSMRSVRPNGQPGKDARPLKVLVMSNLYPPQELGGYGRNIADFADSLQCRGHEILVLTSDTPRFGNVTGSEPNIHRKLQLCGDWQESGQRLFDQSKINGLIRSNMAVVQQALDQFGPEICLVGNIDLLGVPVFTPVLNQGIPVVHYLGNSFPGYEPSGSPRSPHYHVAAASQWLKEDALKRGYPYEKAEVIYPGALVQSFKMAAPPAFDKLRIAYAGLILDSKGPQVLIDALHRIAGQGIDFSCSIAGGTTDQAFVNRLGGHIQDAQLTDRIRFTGQLDRERLKDLFATHNVLVFPSLADETFGISQVEGMAAGLLLITTGVGGAEEVVDNGVTGIRFEPGNADQLARQLVGLTKDALRWQRMATAGQRLAMERFDIERSVDKLESFFFKTLGKRKKKLKSPSEADASRTSRNEPAETTDDIEKLRPLRKQLAELWLNTPVTGLQPLYEGTSGKWHRRFSLPEFKSHPLKPEEQGFLDEQIDHLSKTSRDAGELNRLFAAMLYAPAYRMPVMMDLEKVPDWFLKDYLMFLLECPEGVLKEGEAEEYYRHVKAVTESIAGVIRRAPDSKRWGKMAAMFAERALFSPLYFTKHPLKDIYVSRGDILEYAWKLLGWRLDHQFPFSTHKGRKIRLGIFLTNLNSVTEMQATLPLFEWVDREYFEVFLYVCVQKATQQEAHCRSLSDHFTVLSKDISARAEAIRSDDLDILIFGNNTTTGVNSATILASHRLARFQCVHFCSPVTTGLRHMDYFLLGSLIDPEGHAEEAYSEKILRIQGSGICFSRGPQSKPTKSRFRRGDFGIPEDVRVLVSGANFHKITPELRHVWARIIAATRDSALVLYPFGPAWSQKYPERLFTEEMKKVFGTYGLDENRLVVLNPFKKRDDIPSFLQLTDIYLDATPYSGATSLLDPLEAGVPPVVTEGPELRFCQGAAMLRELEVPDLIAADEDAYIRLAIDLAADDPYRNKISAKISEKMAQEPAFLDSRAYGEKVGRVLYSMVERENGVGAGCFHMYQRAM